VIIIQSYAAACWAVISREKNNVYFRGLKHHFWAYFFPSQISFPRVSEKLHPGTANLDKMFF